MARKRNQGLVFAVALGALGRTSESCRPDSKNLLFAMGLAII